MFRDEFLVHVKEGGCPFGATDDRHRDEVAEAPRRRSRSPSTDARRGAARASSSSTPPSGRASSSRAFATTRAWSRSACAGCASSRSPARAASACSRRASSRSPTARRSSPTSDKARKAQEGVLEFLLVNHPLDCPVCDKGGECPLQDQSLSHGPGESRFVEEKRHWAKPIEIGPLVALDRERCIQCARCTRFADEIAGDAADRLRRPGRPASRSRPFPSEPFNSYFSGNTVQICPGRRAHGDAVPLQVPPVGPRTGRVDLHDVRGRLPHRRPVLGRAARPLSRRRLRPGQPELAVRQGPLRLRGGRRRRAPRRARSCAARRASSTATLARGARRSRAAASPMRSRRSGPPRSASSAAPASPTRTPTPGRSSPRPCSAPTRSTPSSATGCPPSSSLGLPRATIDEALRSPRRRAARRRSPRGAAGALPAAAPGGGERRVCRSSSARPVATALSAGGDLARLPSGRGVACPSTRRDGAVAGRRPRADRLATARELDAAAASAGGAEQPAGTTASRRRRRARAPSLAESAEHRRRRRGRARRGLAGGAVPLGAAARQRARRARHGSRPGRPARARRPRGRPRVVRRAVGRGPRRARAGTPPAILEAAAAGELTR